MSDIYEIKLTWQTSFTAEQKELFCAHYGRGNEKGDWKQGDDGMFQAEETYRMNVRDNPLNFKRMFPDVLVEIGEPVPTTQGIEIINAMRVIRDELTELRSLAGRTTRASTRPGLPNNEIYESDGVARAAMPEWMLAHIRKVCVYDDMCTDMLQGMLDDGWVILAICPQPGQRRPDYILGRF